jgi:maltose alpha-D-glucosyltransferase/alpha-amylase
VITALVNNHPPDPHPRVPRARRAKKGPPHRKYYVRTDTDTRYQETRIIFLATESSNWSWDPVAEQYYWHRFYSHQPDLNFDHPPVMREVINALHFWLKTGIDGLRLDAIPYLVERDGTNNENLPETHDVLKRIRKEIDDHYEGKMVLAEANQWPEDVLPYFGDGDECHMAFHFPLMPRMYMALAQEDRHPIADILRQTPSIPENCQWGIFLRNHDELTLEMVTDKERDYLWQTYAANNRARINLGIRRRLAPLLENHLRKIQLMNSLLFSMPGTPIIYYGDEIGMGDNIYLGDRDGVRTPMQWSPDRNGGFSRADPARLYLPTVMDPIYGYEAVNVEAQHQDPSSLLNWMRRLIAVRKQHSAFGRGNFRLLYPANRKIFAYLREEGDEVILCVVNFSRSAQAVELDLREFAGRVPVELLGRSAFPPIGDLTYLLTLPGYGFFWFILASETEAPAWRTEIPEPVGEYLTLVVRNGWDSLLNGQSSKDLTREVIPNFFQNQRWFAAKGAKVRKTSLIATGEVDIGEEQLLCAEVEVDLVGRAAQRYFLMVGASYDDDAVSFGWPLLPYTLAKIRRGPKVGGVYDAVMAPTMPTAAIEALRDEVCLPMSSGELCFTKTSALDAIELPADVTAKPMGVEQSNSSIQIGDQVILKIYRRIEAGLQPELEIGRFLVEEAKFANTPALLGMIERVEEDGTRTAYGAAFRFLRNQGDGWSYTTSYLERSFDDARLAPPPDEHDEALPVPVEELHRPYLDQAKTLGRRTAEMHHAFATPTEDPAFKAETIEASDLKAWQAGVEAQLKAALDAVKEALPGLGEEDRRVAAEFLEQKRELTRRIKGLVKKRVGGMKTRLHGDYHLGQVLVAQNDFYILDFEGEPQRPLAERRIKMSPLKDVAGMVRSFDYAAWATVLRLLDYDPAGPEIVVELAEQWRDAAVEAFLAGYGEAIEGCPSYPEKDEDARRLLELFLLEKALYEICYEAANRPTWLRIPIRGVLGLIAGESGLDGMTHGND